MAAPQDYFQRVDLKDSGGNGMLNRSGDNVREDFMDAIYSIAPVDTPFMSGIGRATSKDVYTSWLQDDLAEPNPANAAKDGDDIGADSSTRARRAGNWPPRPTGSPTARSTQWGGQRRVQTSSFARSYAVWRFRMRINREKIRIN